MGNKAKELAPIAVSRLKSPGLHFVGGVAGLALQVLPTGGRTWVLRAMIGGRRREMGLGGYPDVTLAGAREAARNARLLIKSGKDPIAEGRAAASALRASRAKDLTFEQAARSYIAAHEFGWRNAKHAQQWRNTLASYAYPEIGGLMVRDVELAHILAVLEPMGLERECWSSAKPIREIFREAFTRADLPYFNPHSFRNTLAQLGERRCANAEAFKSWSQNLGHEGVLTTFTSYGAVEPARQAEIIRSMWQAQATGSNLASRIAVVLRREGFVEGGLV